jgi:two-component system copper resistance phosphate regulon response regulator CusR
MHILVIEDEQKAAAYLKRGLTENGFTVDVALDGEEGLGLALRTHYDLIILPSVTDGP